MVQFARDVSAVRTEDLALITAAQKVEHYEISGYGTARALAEALRLSKVASLLKATEDEEGATDKKLTVVATGIIASIGG